MSRRLCFASHSRLPSWDVELTADCTYVLAADQPKQRSLLRTAVDTTPQTQATSTFEIFVQRLKYTVVTKTSPSFLPTCSTAHRCTFCPSSEAKRNPPFFASLQFYRRYLLCCCCTYGQTLPHPLDTTCQRCSAIILPCQHDADLSSDGESPRRNTKDR